MIYTDEDGKTYKNGILYTDAQRTLDERCQSLHEQSSNSMTRRRRERKEALGAREYERNKSIASELYRLIFGCYPEEE